MDTILVDLRDKSRAMLRIVHQDQRLRGESLRRGKVLDELADDVRRRSCGQARISGRILFVVVQDIDNAKAVDIDQSAADLEREPGDTIDETVGEPKEGGLERGRAGADNASASTLHELMSGSRMDRDGQVAGHLPHPMGMSLRSPRRLRNAGPVCVAGSDGRPRPSWGRCA